MALWKRFWLLFSVIWVVVAGLNAGTLFFLEEDSQEKAALIATLGVAVPTLAFLVGWLLERWRKRR